MIKHIFVQRSELEHRSVNELPYFQTSVNKLVLEILLSMILRIRWYIVNAMQHQLLN